MSAAVFKTMSREGTRFVYADDLRRVSEDLAADGKTLVKVAGTPKIYATNIGMRSSPLKLPMLKFSKK